VFKFRQILIPETFAIFYAIFAALIIYVSRIGFENYPLLLFKSTLLSIFIILTPTYFIKRFPNIFKSKILALFLIFFLIFFSSAITKYTNINILYLFCLLGFILLIKFNFFNLFKNNLFLLIFTLVFCIFTLSAFYHFQYKTPLFIEQIISGASAHRDTLWHATIAGMIKTYGIPSSGIDGIIELNYHTFSHLIIAKFSTLLNINTLQFYTLIAPIIIFPLFFLSFLYTTKEISLYLSTKYRFKSIEFNNPYFWVFFLLLFSFPYSLTLSPENNFEYIRSFSFFIAILFSYFLIGIFFTQLNSKKNKFFLVENLIYFLIIPFITFCIIYSKVSFLYFIFISYIYFYLRLSLYKIYKYNILLIILFCISLFLTIDLVIPMQNEYPNNSWEKEFIIILKSYKEYFFFSLIFIFLRLYLLNINKVGKILKNIKKGKLIDIEYLIILGIFLFPIKYDYFHGIQVFIAILFLSVFSQNIIVFLKNFLIKKKFNTIKKKLSALFFISICFLSIKNILLTDLKFFSSNIAVRESLLEENKLENKGTHEGSKLYWSNVIKNMKSVIFLDFSNLNKVKKKIENINIYSGNYKNEARIIELLKEINKLQNKNEIVIYIPKKIKDYYSFSCDVYMIPFIATAITNISLVNGIPDINEKSCFGHNLEYGYFNYYKKLNFLVDKEYISPKEICDKDLGIKFQRVIEIREQNSVFYFKDHSCR